MLISYNVQVLLLCNGLCNGLCILFGLSRCNILIIMHILISLYHWYNNGIVLIDSLVIWTGFRYVEYQYDSPINN